MPSIEQLGVALYQHRTARDVRVEPLDAPVVEGQHVVLDRLDEPEALKVPELVRVLGGEVVGLGPVGGGVVELPDVVVEGGQLRPEQSHGMLCRVTAVQPLW